MTIRVQELAEIANEQPFGPVLTARSTVRDVCEWLQACDPNGCHTPELAAAEGYRPYTLDEAWEAVADMLGGA